MRPFPKRARLASISTRNTSRAVATPKVGAVPLLRLRGLAPYHHHRLTSTTFEIKTLTAALPMKKTMNMTHSLASPSRPMPMASAFRHLASQSGTGAFQYRTGFSFWVPDCSWHRHFNLFQYRTAQMPDSRMLVFWHLKHCTKGKKATPCPFVLLAVKRDTSFMSTLLMAELNTPCTSTLLMV